MSNTNSVFKKVPAKVQRLNGFDQSHMNLFTGKIGTLIPVLVDRLMPGDKVSLGTTFRVCMPPMATDFLGKVTANVRAFFVPERLLYGGWKEFMMYSGGLADQFKPAGLVRTYLPTLAPTPSESAQGTLLDYLGLKSELGSSPIYSNVASDSALAYHLIWADWYRDPRVQVDPFLHGQDGATVAQVRGTRYTSPLGFATAGGNASFADTSSVFGLRQVNYEKDYFTTAFTDQYGGATPMSVAVAPFVLPANPTSSNQSFIRREAIEGGTGLVANDSTPQSLTQIGTFTIPQVRIANQLERFAEKMSLSGGVYQDAILAEYGVRPADGLVDRSIYLGSLTASVYNNTVYATNSTGSPDSQAENPFAGQQGASSANSKAIGSGSFVHFEAKEHGIFMVLMDVQPHAIYSTGSRRYLFADGDGFVDKFCVPSLAGIGHQAIYQSELVGGTPDPSKIFGFTDRYADLKWHSDEVHGLLRDGASLSAFALQRPFKLSDTPTISSSFIQVGTSDMDNVTAVVSNLSDYGYWCDMYHSYKLVRPLPAYSIPSLEGLENTKTVMVDRNGRRF